MSHHIMSHFICTFVVWAVFKTCHLPKLVVVYCRCCVLCSSKTQTKDDNAATTAMLSFKLSSGVYKKCSLLSRVSFFHCSTNPSRSVFLLFVVLSFSVFWTHMYHVVVVIVVDRFTPPLHHRLPPHGWAFILSIMERALYFFAV